MEVAVAAERFGQRAHNRLPHGQSLDALGAPFGANLFARYAPDLFGIGLEEGEIKLLAESIDEELLEICFGALRTKACFHVTQANPSRVHQPQIGDRARAERNWIVEEPSMVIDAALAGPDQHHFVRGFGIGSLAARDAA